MDKYYENILNQNKFLNNKINTDKFSEKVDNQHIHDAKSNYLNDTTNYMRFLNNVLYGIYLILLAVLGYLLYNKTMSYKAKIAIFTLLLLYPFFISALQDNLRFIYNFLFSDTTNVNQVVEADNKTELSNNYESNNDIDNDDSLDYNNISHENSIIETKTNNINNESSTNFRNSLFTSYSSETYKNINAYLLYFFYACGVGFLYELFATDAFPFNIYLKIFIVILLVGYPYYVDSIAVFVLYAINLMYSLIMGYAYKDPNSKYDTIWN